MPRLTVVNLKPTKQEEKTRNTERAIIELDTKFFPKIEDEKRRAIFHRTHGTVSLKLSNHFSSASEWESDTNEGMPTRRKLEHLIGVSIIVMLNLKLSSQTYHVVLRHRNLEICKGS